MKTSRRPSSSTPSSGLLSYLKAMPGASTDAKPARIRKERLEKSTRKTVSNSSRSKKRSTSLNTTPRRLVQRDLLESKTQTEPDRSFQTRRAALTRWAKGRLAGLIVVVALALLGLLASVMLAPGSAKRRESSAPIPGGSKVDLALSAVGRSEPFTEERTLAFALGGLIKDVKIEEGDAVRAGQILALLEDASQSAALKQAKAALTEAQAAAHKVKAGPQRQLIEQARLEADRARFAYEILKMGSRKESLRALEANLQKALSLADSAKREIERLRPAYQSNAISLEQITKAEDRWDAARAVVDEARARFDLAQKGVRQEELRRGELSWQAAQLEHQRLLALPRPEDLQLAQARVASADAALNAARAEWEKTRLRAPFEGTVLKILARKGERVEMFTSSPVVLMGDLRKICLRVEVDEADVGSLFPNQRIRATAKGLGNMKLRGQVTRIGNRMGRKRLFTDLPDERLDTRVLEVWVQLHGTAAIPVGYRFKVEFLRNKDFAP